MKSEKGSITLFVLIAMIFFLEIAMTAYISASSKLQGQGSDLSQIKASYERDLSEEGLANLYENVAPKCQVKFNYALPEEYQEVEYIKSTGTQYIDTGVNPTNTIDFDLTMKTDVQAMTQNANNIPSNKTHTLFGSGSYNSRILSFNFGASEGQNSIFLWKNKTYIKDVVKVISFKTTDYDPRNKITISEKNDVWKVNNNIIGTSDTVGEWNIPTKTLAIFGQDNRSFYENMYLYSLKIWDNGEILRDYVPCYQESDNTIGLYDLVEGKFYINTSTGTFEKGQNFSTVAVGTMENQKITYGKSQKLKTNEYTRNGYTFTGWNTKEDGTGTTYSDGQEITLTLDEGNSLELYAQWREN